jgi:hypothetical protein
VNGRHDLTHTRATADTTTRRARTCDWILHITSSTPAQLAMHARFCLVSLDAISKSVHSTSAPGDALVGSSRGSQAALNSVSSMPSELSHDIGNPSGRSDHQVSNPWSTGSRRGVRRWVGQ